MIIEEVKHFEYVIGVRHLKTISTREHFKQNKNRDKLSNRTKILNFSHFRIKWALERNKDYLINWFESLLILLCSSNNHLYLNSFAISIHISIARRNPLTVCLTFTTNCVNYQSAFARIGECILICTSAERSILQYLLWLKSGSCLYLHLSSDTWIHSFSDWEKTKSICISDFRARISCHFNAAIKYCNKKKLFCLHIDHMSSSLPYRKSSIS